MNEDERPENFEEMLRKFLEGGQLDPEQLAKAAGLPLDPKMLSELMAQISKAVQSSDSESGVNWPLAQSQAEGIARASNSPVPESVGRSIQSAAVTASLWLDEACDFSQTGLEPKLLTRSMWVSESLGLFKDLASPIANRMANALTENFQENLPEEFNPLLSQASGIMKSAGAAMFAMQLGQALGKLSQEVLSGGDIGLPLFQEARPAFIAQNVSEFVTSLEDESDQVYLYLAVRELAHSRLFKNSRWLREYVVNLITSYARDITIDQSRIMEIGEGLDPNDISSIQQALESGAFIAPRTESQNHALEAIETTLALIEGWVDCITEQATLRLPRAAAIGEAIRRRRAAGGPAEKTFLTLIGLELRPRKLREASAMWKKVGEAVGSEKRDAIWSHPDLLPLAEDILAPEGLISRIQDQNGSDDFDDELRGLLG